MYIIMLLKVIIMHACARSVSIQNTGTLIVHALVCTANLFKTSHWNFVRFKLFGGKNMYSIMLML